MSRARFAVIGTLDTTGRITKGSVTIDRIAGLVIVRPYKRRRTYVLTLGDVATMVCQRVIRGEVAERRREKAARKRTTKAG